MSLISKQHQVKELIKCGTDPKYFINKYVKIQHPMKGTIPFDTYPFQDDVLDALEGNRYNVIVKSRQLGISTVTAAYALWLALFHRDKAILCIATKLNTAQNFITKVKVAYNGLPQWVRSTGKGKSGDSKQHISFGNGSNITALPKSEDAGRSWAGSLLIVDEAAHIDGFDDIWAAILPTLATGGSACMLSSPRGAYGMFYKTYVDAVAGRNDWNPIELKWDVHPERDEQWFEDQKRMYSQRKLAQEFMCEFLGSGDTFVSADDINYLKSIVRSPRRRDGPSGRVWIWEEPRTDHDYIISADVARGDSGGDYSAFHVFDNTEGEVVAEYVGHIRPDEFGKLLDVWGRRYNNALMVPELNTYGHHAITVLQHRDYPNFYYQQQEKNPNFYPGEDDIPGYNMQGKSRRESVVARMEEVIRNRLVKIYSQRFVNEVMTFTYNGKRAQAKKGTHDDLIMSFSIGAKVLNVGQIDESARMMAYAMLAGTNRRTNTFNGIGGPGDHRNAQSSAYANAFAVFNRKSMAEDRASKQQERAEEEKRKQKPDEKQSTQPEAEKDYGARLPADVRRRLGDLNWLL